jgi:outer membrane protein assembly factor BamB
MSRALTWIGVAVACIACAGCAGTLQPQPWTESHSDLRNSGFNAVRTVDVIASTKKWSVDVGALAASTPIVAPNGTLHIGNFAGEAVGINADGTVRFRRRLGSHIIAPAAVDAPTGEVVYIVQNPVTQSEFGSFLYRLSPEGITLASSAIDVDTTGAPKLWRDYVFVVNAAYAFVFDRTSLALIEKAWLWRDHCVALVCAGSDPFSFLWTAGETISCMVRGWPSDCLAKLERGGPVHQATLAILDGRTFAPNPDEPLLFITNQHCASAWRFRPTAAPGERIQFAWDRRFVQVGCSSKRVRSTSPAVIADGRAVFGDQTGRIVSIDPITGQPLWVHENGQSVQSPPVGSLRQIYVPRWASLTVLDSDGTPISDTPLQGYGSMAALSLDHVYVVTSEGVHSFALDPTQASTFEALTTGMQPDMQVQAGLAIGSDGTVYVSTPNGRLHAYGRR